VDVVVGFHAIEELLKSRSGVGYILKSRKGKRQDAIADLAESLGYAVRKSDDEELTRISGTSDHRGIVFVRTGKVSVPSLSIEEIAGREGESSLVLILDGITDPNNFGAVMRSADQFDVDAVVVPRDNSAHESPAAVKASAGAMSYVPIVVVANLVRAITVLKEGGFWVYGADMEGSPLWEAELSGRIAIIMGSEGKGIRRLTAESCDGILSIPTHGHIDSLNVSVAAGIILYEIQRQRKTFKPVKDR